MSDATSVFDPLAAVQALRDQGAAQRDPVGFGVMEALARRAAAQQGEARQWMMQRVVALLAEHAAKSPRGPAAPVPDEHAARRVVLQGLSDLVDQLGRSQELPLRSPQASAPRATARQETTPRRTATAAALRANAVTAFKGTWSRLRADQRLREALAQVPAAAGPLNSSHLINRALQAMRELSPDYLDAFMQHVDTLLWLEHASGAGDLAAQLATPAADGRGGRARANRKA